MDRLRDAPRVTGGKRAVAVKPAKPNVDYIIIEDDTPVDNLFAEKQQRLLTEPLYSSWKGGKKRRRFLALANVGLFFSPEEPPLVPDVMLSLDVVQSNDFSQKENNTYFVWTRGKVPDTVVEIVSDRRGGEGTRKLQKYSTWGIPYYIIFDPRNILRQGNLRAFVRKGLLYEPSDPAKLEGLELGLAMWSGPYEGAQAHWLRWTDGQGQVILTGDERAGKERARAKKERARAKKERASAEAKRRRIEKLEDQVRKLGAEPAE